MENFSQLKKLSSIFDINFNLINSKSCMKRKSFFHFDIDLVLHLSLISLKHISKSNIKMIDSVWEKKKKFVKYNINASKSFHYSKRNQYIHTILNKIRERKSKWMNIPYFIKKTEEGFLKCYWKSFNFFQKEKIINLQKLKCFWVVFLDFPILGFWEITFDEFNTSPTQPNDFYRKPWISFSIA